MLYDNSNKKENVNFCHTILVVSQFYLELVYLPKLFALHSKAINWNGQWILLKLWITVEYCIF